MDALLFVYKNVNNQFFNERLDLKFNLYHAYDFCKVIIPKNSRYSINEFVSIHMPETEPYLFLDNLQFKPDPELFIVFINGQKITGTTDEKIFSLNENAIIEVTLIEPDKKRITTQTVIVAKLLKKTPSNPDHTKESK